MNLDTATGQIGLFDDSKKYEAFTEKFKPKKTTDDCYTPENIYSVIADWVCREYSVYEQDIFRPFWPGSDYRSYPYPEGCAVVDNPPFSLLAQILSFYLERKIPFFLFAPTLTLFSGAKDVTYIPCGVSITYDNGARVNTSFVTNLDTCRVRSAPELYQEIRRENDRNEKAMTRQLPKYEYPDHLLTAAAAYQYSRLGVSYRLEKSDCVFVRALDAQKAMNKTIFGGGFLLSDRAAADRAAADRAAADRAAAECNNTLVWALSEREMRIAEGLNRDHRDPH